MGIEKIGLPAKREAKGSTWVLDASSCQTCQTPFALFNRKHHFRRCGGLFCGACSNSKVILRSQGDTPVRVCEPCKTLEEAARFQLRHRGKQNKTSSTSTLFKLWIRSREISTSNVDASSIFLCSSIDNNNQQCCRPSLSRFGFDPPLFVLSNSLNPEAFT